MFRSAALFLFLVVSLTCFSQEDTSFNKILDEIVVTATKTERKLGNVAVPVTIINKKTIQQAGSVRLKDILQEQAGLFITNSFGAGVQMQGLNPDYTLILIDGEPLVGRTAGTLDINRLTVGNIKKVEIVKGPSSSLYGSEAMAGVINIITDQTHKKNLEAGIRYGFGNPDKGWAAPAGANTFKNTDINLHASTTINKLGIHFFSNANYLDGISFRPFSTDKVAQPIWRLTNQLQLNYLFNTKSSLAFSLRHAYDHIKQEFAVSNNGQVTNSYGREANSDVNINLVYNQQVSNKVKNTLRFYNTLYDGSQRLKYKEIPDSVYNDQFKQYFYRLEDQADINWEKMTLTAGAGFIIDRVRSTRYDNFSDNKTNSIAYGFVQHEWRVLKDLTILSGIRYDNNKLYAGAFSPKLAVRYKASKKVLLNASIGRGFKAPDFRQLYLNFTNNAAGGYSVFGSIDAVKIITELQRTGQVADVNENFYKLKELKPEFSTGVNVGGTYFFSPKLSFKLNAFRNDIDELIDVRQVATKTTGAQIYSYINVKKAFTQGGELEANWQPFKNISLSSGYQLLLTADKDELKAVKAGKTYTRDANGSSRIMNRSEYIGLPGRSKHMANLKISYENQQQFFATVRLIYRSKWAVTDADGNGVYNTNDEFAPGFLVTNVSAGKEFKKGLRVQAGMDNVFNYQDNANLPNFQGRMIYAGIRYNFIKTSK